MENFYLRRPFSFGHEESAFHQRDPKTGIIAGAEPFYFEGKGREALICVHGFTSTPRDLRSLGEALNAKGLTVQGILLPGHGTRPTDLDHQTWQAWYGALEAAYLALRKKFETIHLAGFSMGGSLALHLAANHPVGKLALLSPFFKIAYNPWKLIPQEWLVFTVGRVLRHLKKKHSGNCRDKEARKRHIAYYHYSLSAIRQALALVEVVRGEIGRIANPTLILHAKGDWTTSPSASRRFFDALPSPDKRFVWLYRSNHIITHDYDKARVFMEVEKFLMERPELQR